VCGTKNFSSVRLYSAPQLHRTIVAILRICARNRPLSSVPVCHNQTNPLPKPRCCPLVVVAPVGRLSWGWNGHWLMDGRVIKAASVGFVKKSLDAAFS
jgi:hypothetical protein